MCEFKVYLTGDTPEEKKLVAKEIIIVKIREGRVVLLNMMGDPIYVDSAIIKEVNTMSQELLLQKVTSS
jgi:predicted RNA-binding protein